MEYKRKSKAMTAVTLTVTLLMVTVATTIGAYAAPNSTDTSVMNTPWPAMGGTGQPYTYSQAGYYQGAYIFELGWNLNEKGYGSYSDKAEIILSDRTTITVSFDESCKSDAQNRAVLTDLQGLIEKLKKQYSDSNTPLEKPLVVSVKYVGESSLVELAEEYYKTSELTAFSAIFSALDIEIQKEYCNKMLADNKNAFFSSTARYIDTEMVNYYAEKAYEADKIAFFTNVAPYLTSDQKQLWIARASNDNRNAFLSVLTK